MRRLFKRQPNTAEAGIEMEAPLARRRRSVLMMAVASVAFSAGALVGAIFVKSPQQLLADSAPPNPTLLTTAVERRVLASTLVNRGTVVPASAIEVTPVASGAAVQVVTAVGIKPGDQIKPGQVLAAVSGRPLIALPGAMPGYRDLRPGHEGPDVWQLQQALRQLGYPVASDRPRYFGAGTKTAIRKLYADRGYQAADTGGKADRAALREIQSRVDTIKQSVDAMQRRIAAGETAGQGEEPLPAQLVNLQKALTAAKLELNELLATTGTMLPLSEFVFVPQFPARVATFTAKVGDAVKAPLLTLSTGQLTVLVKLRPDQAKLLKPGMAVKLTSETLGQEREGVVASVGELTNDQPLGSAGTAAPEAPYHPVNVSATAALPASWEGQDVRVRITSAQTQQPVLVVPLSAVSAGADGRTTVSVSVGTQLVLVEVQAGVSADGFVEVTPIGGALHDGDRVVVGLTR